MKFYLASSFELVDLVRRVANILVNRGHEITVRWWNRDWKKSLGWLRDEDWYRHSKVVEVSERNFQGIRDCDVFLLVADSTPRKFNGANIELGYALALNKPCYSIGKLERSAMYVPVLRRMFPQQVLEEIGEEASNK